MDAATQPTNKMNPQPRKIITLAGSFGRSQVVADAMQDLEAALAELKTFTDAGDYGSADYFEALKRKKEAEAIHAAAVRALRS